MLAKELQLLPYVNENQIPNSGCMQDGHQQELNIENTLKFMEDVNLFFQHALDIPIEEFNNA